MNVETEAIWKNFHRELFNFIKKRVSDEDLAKDLLQDVFVKIHLKQHTLVDKSKLTSWVYQITRNSILDHYKKPKKQTELNDNIIEIPEEVSLNADFSSCLNPFIDQLPEHYKQALLQTELGVLSQKEYADKAGISYSGAKSRVQRAKQLLYELFIQCCKVHVDPYGNIVDYRIQKKCAC